MNTASMSCCEHLAIVEMGGGETVGPFLDGIAMRPVDIAHGDDLVRTHFVGGIKQVRMRPPAPMTPTRSVSFAPSTRVEASAVSPLAMMKLRRFSILGVFLQSAFTATLFRHGPGGESLSKMERRRRP